MGRVRRFGAGLAAVVSALLVMVSLASPPAQANPDGSSQRDLTVATYNVYLGADLTPLFAAPNLPAFRGSGRSGVRADGVHRLPAAG